MKFQNFLPSVFTLLVFISSFSCKPKQEEVQTKRVNRLQSNDSALTISVNPKIIAFQTYLQQLDKTDIASASKALNQYTTSFEATKPETCDSAFVHLQQLMDSVEIYQNIKLDKDTTDYEIIFSGEKVPKRITDFVNKLNVNGFRVQMNEDYPLIIQDRKYIAERVGQLISDTLKTYLHFIDREYKTGFAEFDSIIISPQELVERIIWYETFIQNNPNFVFVTECEQHLKAYITYIVLGFGKTKYFVDEKNLIVSEYYRHVNEFIFNIYSNTTTAQKLKDVNDALNEKNLNKVNEARKALSIKGYIFNIQP